MAGGLVFLFCRMVGVWLVVSVGGYWLDVLFVFDVCFCFVSLEVCVVWGVVVRRFGVVFVWSFSVCVGFVVCFGSLGVLFFFLAVLGGRVGGVLLGVG